jgi:hypothetical protein
MPAYSSENGTTLEGQSCAILVVAHPGHELRVHGWLETARPQVWVLTDGSGRSGRSRLDSTTRILEATGAVRGPVYGEMSDMDLYDAVLNFKHQRFTNLIDQLASTLIENDVNCIAGDAEEGYNPAHDICRLIINAAVNLVERKTDKQIPNYDFSLSGAPGQCPEDLRARSLWINLDDDAFTRKLSAARDYPELQAEVEAALSGTDANNFRTECLRPVNSHTATSIDNQVPFYEEYGERQVKAGHYSHVLRYNEHMLPLAAALKSYVERSS